MSCLASGFGQIEPSSARAAVLTILVQRRLNLTVSQE